MDHGPAGPRRSEKKRESRPIYARYPDSAQFSYVTGLPCDSGLALYPQNHALGCSWCTETLCLVFTSSLVLLNGITLPYVSMNTNENITEHLLVTYAGLRIETTGWLNIGGKEDSMMWSCLQFTQGSSTDRTVVIFNGAARDICIIIHDPICNSSLTLL